MLPISDARTLIVSKEPSGCHTRYHPTEDLGRLEPQRTSLTAPVDQLTFEIRPMPAGGGAVVMKWETTEVSAPFTVVR